MALKKSCYRWAQRGLLGKCHQFNILPVASAIKRIFFKPLSKLDNSPLNLIKCDIRYQKIWFSANQAGKLLYLTLFKKRTFFLCLLTLCLKGVNCRLGDMCEGKKALCVADMLSTHVWLHVTLFLLSLNLRLMLDAILDPIHTHTPVSFNFFFILLFFGGWGEKCLCISFESVFSHAFQSSCLPDPKPAIDSKRVLASCN